MWGIDQDVNDVIMILDCEFVWLCEVKGWMLIGGLKKRLEMGWHDRKTIRSLISDITGKVSCHRYFILYNKACAYTHQVKLVQGFGDLWNFSGHLVFLRCSFLIHTKHLSAFYANSFRKNIVKLPSKLRNYRKARIS